MNNVIGELKTVCKMALSLRLLARAMMSIKYTDFSLARQRIDGLLKSNLDLLGFQYT